MSNRVQDGAWDSEGRKLGRGQIEAGWPKDAYACMRICTGKDSDVNIIWQSEERDVAGMVILMCTRTDWQCTGPNFTGRQGLTRSCPRPLPARSRIPVRCALGVQKGHNG